MPKVTQKPSAKKRGRPRNIPPPYPPPPPPPPPPMNNPYYQKFFEEYWKKYATGYQGTPGIPPPPPAGGGAFAKLPTMVVPAIPPMTSKVPPPSPPKAPATRIPNGLHKKEYPINDDRKTYVLARPNDSEYLSEKQCYVRTRLAEIFIAEDADVTKRVRGRRAAFAGQVGLRCVFCVPALDAKHRIERAICYPTTTNKFYQTVQDMQHFHFNSCPAIPRDVKEMYQNLRGNMNKSRKEEDRKLSPRDYWKQCCDELGIVDHIGDDGSNVGVKLKGEDGEHGLVERSKLKTEGYAKELFMPPGEDAMEVNEEKTTNEESKMEKEMAEEVVKKEGEGFDELVADLDGKAEDGDEAGEEEDEEARYAGDGNDGEEDC